MPKSSTQFNADESVKTKENKVSYLKKGTVESILNFSRSYKVYNSGLISQIDLNIN